MATVIKRRIINSSNVRHVGTKQVSEANKKSFSQFRGINILLLEERFVMESKQKLLQSA
jgi:hypothetical protein